MLKPGGRFYLAASGQAHLQELGDLAAHLMDGASLRAFRETFGSQPFKLESGETLLQAHFDEVTLRRSERNDLFVTEAEPLVAFFLSMNSSEMFKKEPAEEVKERLEFFRTHLNTQIAERGFVHITRDTGLLEAS